MNARERFQIMVRTDRGSMTVWSPAEVRTALDAVVAEVRAEAFRDAYAAIEDPAQRRAAGGGLGWETARDVVHRLIRKATPVATATPTSAPVESAGDVCLAVDCPNLRYAHRHQAVESAGDETGEAEVEYGVRVSDETVMDPTWSRTEADRRLAHYSAIGSARLVQRTVRYGAWVEVSS